MLSDVYSGFKKRAPRAVGEIKKFATEVIIKRLLVTLKMMGTKDVRVDSSLNKAVWAHGIKLDCRWRFFWMVYFESLSVSCRSHVEMSRFACGPHGCSFLPSRNVPFRLRIRLARKRNEDEDAKEKLYTLVTHVQIASCKGTWFGSPYLTLKVSRLWPMTVMRKGRI